MSAVLVSGGTVLTPFEQIDGGRVLARDGRIERVGRDVHADGVDLEIDAAGCYVCPGFIDLQVNGGGGALLTEEPTADAIARMTSAHARFGTTAMLPTVVTSSEEAMARALEAVADAVDGSPAARALGAHLEGPFINPKRCGAHDERSIRAPDVELFGRLHAASRGSLRLITLAPELPGALDLIAAARAAGVAVAIGHTDATYDEALSAIDAGTTLATHVFNAMRPLSQRDPGVVGAVLERDDIVASLIADGVHVHPAVLLLVARSKGPKGVALVTDAMPPAGQGEETFRFERRGMEVRDGACYLPDGTLAGSVLTMDRAVRTMRAAGVPLLDAVRMATATPASVLGLDGEVGVLRAGARADIVVLDGDLNVRNVIVGGEVVVGAS